MAVVLTNPNKVNQPDWLTDTSGADSLRSFQSNLPSLFDTSGLANSARAYNDSFSQRAEMGFDAQSRAAQNRAMLSGGRVGSSFAKGGLMLGLQQNRNQMQYDYARMAAQMMAQRAGAEGQVAGQLADYGQRHQGMMADWTQGQQGMQLQAATENQRSRENARLAAAQMAQQKFLQQQQLDQQKDQFGQNMSLQRDQFGLQQQQFNRQGALAALQAMGKGGFAYNTYNSGAPMSSYDAQIKAQADQFNAQRQNLINRLGF